ncbi:type VII secretion target [Streptomyces cinnamoneus]|uniref:type VII secretion target n=1 Tax=Streptomyces cinnamoneus TaxID=53446 RepID=UPI0033CD3D64
MDLRVDPTRLEGFSRQMRRGTDDAREVLHYATKFTDVSEARAGLFGMAYEAHSDLRGRVLGALSHLSDVLSGSSEELRNAAAYYRGTDRSVAARLDAAYGREGR